MTKDRSHHRFTQIMGPLTVTPDERKEMKIEAAKRRVARIARNRAEKKEAGKRR